jgi:uncharacterized damage-inducible protein DinB
MTSARASDLAERLRRASDELAAAVRSIDEDAWDRVPAPGVWSIGKDVEHAIEAAAYHQWIVRRTIGQPVPLRRPVLERARLISPLSPAEGLDRLREQAAIGIELVARLTDSELDRPTIPRRAGNQRLAETIERVLIGHSEVHRAAIEAKRR